jgi:Glycosyl hydrolase family 20, catalytic domain
MDESYHIHIPGISISSPVSFLNSSGRPPLTMYDTYFGKMMNMITEPHHDTDDHIFHNTNQLYGQITATNVYGIIHALQSLRLLIEFGWMIPSSNPKLTPEDEPFYVMYDTPIIIHDQPKYSYRGLMIDTSRHFIPLSVIQQNLHAMEMNKLNVFHWHVTDRDSWPYQSIKYPELVQHNAAYCPTCIYTIDDIKTIILDAADRGIRTIIEIDLPGHTKGKIIFDICAFDHVIVKHRTNTYGYVFLTTTHIFLFFFFFLFFIWYSDS